MVRLRAIHSFVPLCSRSLSVPGRLHIAGIIFPAFTFIFAGLLDSFFNANAVQQIDVYAGYMAIIAAGTFVASIMGFGSIIFSSERQGSRIRKAYIRALLRAEMGYHDVAHTAEVSSRMTADVAAMLDGMGEKLVNFTQFFIQFVAGICLGFSRGPAIAAVVCAFMPLLALCAAGMKVLLTRITKLEADAYARAGEVAAETITNVRTVASYCGEEAEVKRYDAHLGKAERMGRCRGLAQGLTMGGVWASIMFCYGVGLWFGAQQIIASRNSNPACITNPTLSGCVTGGTVINVRTAGFEWGERIELTTASTSSCSCCLFICGALTPTLSTLPPSPTRRPYTSSRQLIPQVFFAIIIAAFAIAQGSCVRERGGA